MCKRSQQRAIKYTSHVKKREDNEEETIADLIKQRKETIIALHILKINISYLIHWDFQVNILQELPLQKVIRHVPPLKKIVYIVLN